MIDLHLHSTCSDGTLSPTELAAKINDLHLYGFSLTDHDTVEGIPEILSSRLDPEIIFIPGIELSCDAAKHEIHILGYGIDWKNSHLSKQLSSLREGRQKRNFDMIKLFQKDGYPITLEKLQNGNPDTVITRAHFARVLLEEGICKSKDQAFRTFLGENCKYFLPKPFFAPEDALNLILQAGGVPVLAHPFQYKFSNQELQNLIEQLTKQGLQGLEIYHSSQHINQTIALTQWAKKYHLIGTGGSDFHGSNKPDISIGTGRGSLHVPNHLMDQLLSRLK